jgi:NAD(P)-dependent dehydrogenase (short-subunit alcohol dehydrogenase family)
MEVMKSLRLDGKVALVTGAGSGIGRAYAEAVAEAGADVACLDWHPDACEETAAIVQALGRRAIALDADVTNEVQLREAFDRAEAELGPITISFANAGVVAGGDVGDIRDMTLDTWNHVIGVNLTGVFLTLRESVRKMQPQGYGKIISTASIYGYVGAAGGLFAYTSSKGGVVNLTRTLAVSVAGSGIRVNAIAPGFVTTNLSRRAGVETSDEQVREATSHIPVGAFAVPDDLKGLAVFLASPSSDYCTGCTYPVDGGWLAS